MSRVVHFGVVRRDGVWFNLTTDDTSQVRDLLAGTPFQTDGDSFTDYGESLERDDALHVMHVTDCEEYDEDDDPIRLSPEEVSEIVSDLRDRLWRSAYRLVDYWIEGDHQVWGQDDYLYGPYALQSVSGRKCP